MKKTCLLLLSLLFIFSLSACLNLDSTLPEETMLEKLTEYQEKIQTIIENEDSSNQLTSLHQNYNQESIYDDPYMVSREAYMDVYNQQRDNHLDVALDYVMSEYVILLDEVIDEMNEQDIDVVSAEIQIEFRNIAQLDVYVLLLSDGGILFKLSIDTQNESYYSGLKMGYEGDDFFLRELTKHEHEDYYEYFEFLENHQMINLRHSPQSYWYRYQSQNDETYYEISEFSEWENVNFSLRWFNSETNVRTTMSAGGESSNLIELFNDQGIYFSYLDFLDTNTVWVAWQLLEATGWDYVYNDPDTVNPLNGVYKNGEKIFTDARLINIDLTDMFANVRVEYSLEKQMITKEMLNLSMFGLSFVNQDLELEDIELILSTALEESAHLSVYRGIDFLNDDLNQVLYDVIDDDIKP